MPETSHRIAVLIDADNAPASKIDAILAEVATFGNAHVRRAYGDWTRGELKGWTAILQDYAIAPVQQFAYTKGKNASDMALVIDAMDLLHAGTADGFAIVSSDADFTPLVMRLRQSGATVLGFGQEKTPDAFANACSQFLYIDRVEAPDDDEDEDPRLPARRMPRNELRQNARLVQMLRTAVDAASDDDGWANLGAVGNQIANQSSFQPRNFGYAKWIGLIDEIDLFEVERSNNAVTIRRKPTRRSGRK